MSIGRRSAISTRASARRPWPASTAVASGDASPGRNESRGEGICRRAEPGRSGHPGAVEICRRGARARRRGAGQSARRNDAEAHIGDISMPLSERTERWTAMMKALRRSSIHVWFADFMDALGRTRSVPANSSTTSVVRGSGQPSSVADLDVGGLDHALPALDLRRDVAAEFPWASHPNTPAAARSPAKNSHCVWRSRALHDRLGRAGRRDDAVPRRCARSPAPFRRWPECPAPCASACRSPARAPLRTGATHRW